MSYWIPIKVKYPNKCKQCNGLIKEGESALYLQNLGIKHKECPTGIESIKDESSLVIIDEEDKKLLGMK